MRTSEQYLTEKSNRGYRPLPSANGTSRSVGRGITGVETTREAKRLLIYLPRGGESVTLRAYGQYLANLLQGQATFRLERSGEEPATLKATTSSFDLVLLGEPEQTVVQKLARGSYGRRVTQEFPTSILLARQPHWPIRRILLVIRVEESEVSAVDWAGQLARTSGAQLTILPLVPYQALIFGSASRLQVGIDSLLTPDTPCGERLRLFLDQLRRWQVNGTLRVRQGDPLWQICWEIESEDYDLVVIGAEQHSRVRRWLFGELVGSLVDRIDRPLLVVGAGHKNQAKADGHKVVKEESNDR